MSKNFRPDKKLKRKKAWKQYKKIRNILKFWRRSVANGKQSKKNPPVRFSQPLRMKKLLKRIAKKLLKDKKNVVKLKWYQKLWKKIKTLLIRKK